MCRVTCSRPMPSSGCEPLWVLSVYLMALFWRRERDGHASRVRNVLPVPTRAVAAKGRHLHEQTNVLLDATALGAVCVPEGFLWASRARPVAPAGPGTFLLCRPEPSQPRGRQLTSKSWTRSAWVLSVYLRALFCRREQDQRGQPGQERSSCAHPSRRGQGGAAFTSKARAAASWAL